MTSLLIWLGLCCGGNKSEKINKYKHALTLDFG